MSTAGETGLATPSHRRVLRRRMIDRMAAEQAGVVSRTQLYGLGVTRGEVRAEVRAQRWGRVGRNAICIHRGPLSTHAQHWVAVIEGGPRAFLDGGSALIEAGLQNFQMQKVRVSVPRGARVWRVPGMDIRQTRRWSAEDLAPDRLRRSRVEVAAVRHALWARSNREAALVLTMVVQQQLTTVEQLGVEMLRVRRDKRRGFIHGVLLDLAVGVRSLGELEVARGCRERGFPEPSRQVLRRGRNGTYYLDAYWDEFDLVVEVDGIQHVMADQVVQDALRQNDLTLSNARVLRLPLLGLRVAPEQFFAQIGRALAEAGCVLPGSRTA